VTTKQKAAGPVRTAERQARRATREAKPWVVKLARLGYAARGIVYIIVGWLAFQAAQGTGSPNVDTHTALAAIIAQPFGRFLLGLVALGLVGYGIWRLVEAIMDPENAGSEAKGILTRIGYVISAITYGGLAAVAVRMIMGTGSAGSTNQAPKDWTARLLTQPFGHWFIILAGLAVVALGLFNIYLAFKVKFEKRFDTREMSARSRRWAIDLGRIGYGARAVLYVIIGVFLVQAALEYNPQRAGGLGDALAALARGPYGTRILGVIALGLLALGIYSLVLARYRRIYV
jgi:hypothetical protein